MSTHTVHQLLVVSLVPERCILLCVQDPQKPIFSLFDHMQDTNCSLLQTHATLSAVWTQRHNNETKNVLIVFVLIVNTKET